MATRRRIGVSIATTEAARRQLMQPVPCWEKVWETPKVAAPGSTLKVYKWVKTNRKQSFSDEEEEPDMPLAPLPDIEQEGDEDTEQDEQAGSVAPESASRAVSEPVTPNAPQETEEPSVSTAPKPHPLSMSMVPPDSPTPAPEIDEATLDAELKPLEPELDLPPPLDEEAEVALQVPPELSAELDVADLEMAALGPDGTQFEATGNLDQLQGGTDALLGGEAMDEAGDPFSTTT